MLTETHISNESNTEEISEHLDSFSMHFNNDISKYKSLALGLKKSSVQISDIMHVSGFSIVKFSKESFSDRIFTALLLYRSHQDTFQSFFYKLATSLIEVRETDIILGDFNINLLKESNEKEMLQYHLRDFQQIVEGPTHVDGGLIDHVYIRKSLLEKFSAECITVCLNLSDHDAVTMRVQII